MKKCEICGTKISKKNDSFLKQFLTKEEIAKVPTKSICTECKRDLMFANLIAIL